MYIHLQIQWTDMKKLITIIAIIYSTISMACVEVSDYATGQGVETSQIQNAINAAGPLGCVNFTQDLKFDSTLYIPQSQTWNGSIDWVATAENPVVPGRLMYVGTASPAISGSNVHFDKIVIQGNEGVNSALNPAIGIDINSGNIRMTHSTVRGFTTLIKVRNSYYNLFEATNLMHANVLFDGGGTNNLNFTNCKFSRFDTGIQYTGGVGGINILGGSIERWTKQITNPLAGAKVAITVVGAYVENYPDLAASQGLVAVNYHAVFGFITSSTFTMTGSIISMKGIERLVYDYNGFVTMDSNTIIINGDVTTPSNYLVYEAGTASMIKMNNHIKWFKNGVWVNYDPAVFSIIQIAGSKLNYDYLGFDLKRHQSAVIP